MRYALIGCSRISKNHFIAAKNNALELVGVCDIGTERMKWFLRKMDMQKMKFQIFGLSGMLNAEKPDLVSIATGSGSHGKIALDCIEAGVHVILEKPIALSMKEADAIVEASERVGVKVAMCTKPIQSFSSVIEKSHGSRTLREAFTWSGCNSLE
jgi:UDP-N-acetyl-2-amino-2-deoxyglucuronate dehydrogenase